MELSKETQKDILAHHGIQGQKWGKRNGPPYPLDQEDYSKAEKLGAKLGKKVAKGEAKYYKKALTDEQKSNIARAESRMEESKRGEKKTYGIKDDALTDEERVGKAKVLAAMKPSSVTVVPIVNTNDMVTSAVSTKLATEALKGTALEGNKKAISLLAAQNAASMARDADTVAMLAGMSTAASVGIAAAGAVATRAITYSMSKAVMARRQAYVRNLDPEFRKLVYQTCSRMNGTRNIYSVVNLLYKVQKTADSYQDPAKKKAFVNAALNAIKNG